MKFNTFVALTILTMAFILSSCGEKDASIRDAARQSLPQKAPQDMLDIATQRDQSVAASSVFHYTCPNGCEGGGAATQGSCPVCGTSLIHNQAYHDQPATPTTPEPAIQDMSTTVPPSGQNSAGVWHYTCPNGCAGGAGSAGSCASCGTALAHNQAYHSAPAAPAAGANNSIDLQQMMQQPSAPQPTTQSAQNAAGVFHYTCPNGCAGGAGSAGSCAACGATLAHNQAYHNN